MARDSVTSVGVVLRMSQHAVIGYQSAWHSLSGFCLPVPKYDKPERNMLAEVGNRCGRRAGNNVCGKVWPCRIIRIFAADFPGLDVFFEIGHEYVQRGTIRYLLNSYDRTVKALRSKIPLNSLLHWLRIPFRSPNTARNLIL